MSAARTNHRHVQAHWAIIIPPVVASILHEKNDPRVARRKESMMVRKILVFRRWGVDSWREERVQRRGKTRRLSGYSIGNNKRGVSIVPVSRQYAIVLANNECAAQLLLIHFGVSQSRVSMRRKLAELQVCHVTLSPRKEEKLSIGRASFLSGDGSFAACRFWLSCISRYLFGRL